jgi:hypothetical protein
VLAGVLAFAGCGLSDYEAQVSKQQQLVEKLEKAEKILGDPVDVPPAEKNAEAPQVFLRLPRGMNTRGEKRPFAGQLYYSFTRSDNSSPFPEVLLAVQTSQTGKEPSLKKEDIILKVKERYNNLDGKQATPVVIQPLLRSSPMEFQYIQLDRGSFAVALYLLENPGLMRNPAAVIFTMEKDKALDPATREKMETSLQSLVLGAEAFQERAEYDRFKASARAVGTPPIRR